MIYFILFMLFMWLVFICACHESLLCTIYCNLGFNCGEAANFGTPQWLTVAKEAAVRRAAMNYLPMLSHQQLLYLLTVSFVSR